jgi:hypothetical protein
MNWCNALNFTLSRWKKLGMNLSPLNEKKGFIQDEPSENNPRTPSRLRIEGSE